MKLKSVPSMNRSIQLRALLYISMSACLSLPFAADADSTLKTQDALINGVTRTLKSNKSTAPNLNARALPSRSALDVPSSASRVALTAQTKAPRGSATSLHSNLLTLNRMNGSRTKYNGLYANNDTKIAANADAHGEPETSSGKMEGNEFSPNGTQNLKLDDKTNGELQRFHFRWRSYNAMDLDAAEGASGIHPGTSPSPVDHEVRAWERIDLRYSFDEVLSFAVMPQFNHTWFGDPNRTQDTSRAGLNQNYSFFVGNTALVLNDDKIFDLGNDFLINGFARYDLPTSEASIMDNSLGESWLKVGVAKKVGKFGFEINETYRKYFQQYTSSQLLDISDPTQPALPAQNLNYRLTTALDSTYEINSWLSLFLEVGERSQAFFADASTNRSAISQNNLIINPEVDFTVNKHLSFALGIFGMPNATVLDQNSYSPLTTDSQNANEGYLMMSVEF